MAFSNPYTQVIIEHWDKTESDRVLLTAEDRAKLPKIHVKTASGLNKTWGPWELTCQEYENTVYYAFWHEACRYEIELNSVRSTADILDWLMHMSGKSENAYGESFVYFLGSAFDDLLSHSNINRRKNVEFDGKKVAAAYYRDLRPKRAVSARTRHLVLERDRFCCCDCGASPSTGAVLEVDHTIPIARGGSNELHNLRTLCVDCNRGKSDRLVQYTGNS
jgi:5-methylcytosine-specific restriction endonuclease McrA